MSRGRLLDVVTFGPRRRRRWMTRRLRELDRADASGRSTRPIRAGNVVSRWTRALAFLLIVSVGTGVLLEREFGVSIGPDGISLPERLAPAPVDAGVGGSHEFLKSHQGRPVTYSPCEPIRILVNDALAPRDASQILDEAVARIEEATGLSLHITGTTDELPSDRRGPRQSVQHGGSWPPVLIAWTTPEEEPDLRGDVAGVGGSLATRAGLTPGLRYVTGIVALDAPALTRMLAMPDGLASVRAVVMHELAHLVGLAHTDDPAELMHEDNLGLTDFGSGDLEGLAALGTGPCL